MKSPDETDGVSVHKSMTSRTYDRLRHAIITARYRPGERLRIDALKEEFDASLGAVREALARLTSEGLVTAEPQRGFSVSLISRQDLIDLTQARIVIETTCVESSIANGNLAWEGRVLSVAHQLSRLTLSIGKVSADTETWHRYHERYHDEIASACTNSWWLRLRKQLFVQSERYRRLSGPFAEYDRDIDAEHRAISAAVLARDGPRAKTLLADHLRVTTDILLASKMPFSSDPAPAQLARSAGG
ncbi:GntR family transcriptional regulator [Aquibium sp. ELW1220]|uniref:GntR family transcriptional regulator n=1 Tax=Aquibium sp. ELW1220 TaxID=2976766 RepID=UPI0025B1C24E|nr:GntR family transcriptional regulator [Aquibium sp. ELW1220]MDN2580950.1 GntR family transcriptional regulator [Aquibium sp. ELW1220]